jgi:hypothetical protein
MNSFNDLATNIAQQVISENAMINLAANDLAVSIIDLTDPQHRRSSHFRSDELIYPASIVKLFYLVATYQWLKDKKIKETSELSRALRDMIADSSNDATHYVVDLLTETVSGPELPPEEMSAWSKKRNSISEFFHSFGYAQLNISQKPWSEGPYGRDKLFVGKNRENRNRLTANHTAKLLADIATRTILPPQDCDQMMDILKRDFHKQSDDPDDQATKFIGSALLKAAPDAKLYSKAGWTSAVRHDAAYIELSSKKHFVLVVFTTNHSQDYNIIPAIAEKTIAAFNPQ